MNKQEITTLPFSAKIAISWSFLWRSVVVGLAAGVCSTVAGGILGFVFALVGMPRSSVPIAAGLVGLLIGFLFLYVFIRWLLSSHLGRFKLVLVNASDEI